MIKTVALLVVLLGIMAGQAPASSREGRWGVSGNLGFDTYAMP